MSDELKRALTPMVASLIFMTAKALRLDIEADREALIAALERDDTFADAILTIGEDTGPSQQRLILWKERYSKLDPAVRRTIVSEALERLRGGG